MLAVGCGGDDDGDSSATDWADGVCSAITTWSDSLESTIESVRAGGRSEDELRSAVDDLESATNDFVDDLRGLGAPETESGQEAKESVDQLANDVEEGVSTIEGAVEDVSSGGGVGEAITVIGTSLSTMGQQLSATVTRLEQLDPGGELEEAFRDADSCDELTSGES
jgi:uncharacterized protein YoxC